MFEGLFGEHVAVPFEARSVGRSIPRADGRLKVTGAATFTAEHRPEGLVHGIVIGSAIACGRITAVDIAEAEALPGVVAVITPFTAPRLKPLPDKVQGIQYSGEGGLIEMLLPMQDDRIHYAGQAVVLVAAESFEQATYAASLVGITYEEAAPDLDTASHRSSPKSYCGMEPLQLSTGHPEKTYDAAEVRLERAYETPVHTHSAIEMLSTVAEWETRDGEDFLVIHDTTRVIKTLTAVLAHCVAMPVKNIHLLVKFLGGSYGSKAWMFGNVLLVASCAKAIGRPLKVEWTRQQMFELNGYRPATRQTIQIGAARDGKLLSLRHDAISPTSTVSGYPEPVTGMMMMYDVPNLGISQEIRHLNLPTSSPMRGVGVLAGGWALETAMDELAHELGIDPIELKMRNDAKKGPMPGHPFSSKHLDRCFARGKELIGWYDRPARPGERRDGRWVTGLGIATSTLPAVFDTAAARATLRTDGTAEVCSATHEIGNGAYTVFRQIAADALALPVEAVTFDLGDSSFPEAPITAGSRTTASVGAAVLDAGRKLLASLKDAARLANDGPLSGIAADEMLAADGRLSLKVDPGAGEGYAAVLRRAGKESLSADGSFIPASRRKFSVSALSKLLWGYCTPGQIISAIACVQEGNAGTREDVQEFMSGNLCRCAAYSNIIDAINNARALMKDRDQLARR